MTKQAPAVEAFNKYAQQRIWYYARKRPGVSVNPAAVNMFLDFFIAGVGWGREQERKERTRKAAKKA